MNKDLKQTLAFMINLNSQILQNQVDASNGILTVKGLDHSQILINDCVEVIGKLTKESTRKPIKNLEDVNLVFNYWNHPKINLLSHRVISDHSSSIIIALKNYSIEEINLAIGNFSIVCNSDLYHDYRKRPLKDFLKNYLLKFIESANPLENFRKKDYGNKTNQSAIISDEEREAISAQFN